MECWVVDPGTDTIEVVRLFSEGTATEAIYGATDTLRSVALGDLALPLRRIVE